jgi:hypothetical protein
MSSQKIINLHPKISWAQNRRSVHVSILIRGESNSHPSIVLRNENKTVSIQCQGCLPNEDPNENLRSFDVTLNLFASVLPISASSQIKVTDRYVRIILFKKAKKSWEKLIDTTNIEQDSSSSAEYYRRNLKTAVLYDWDLDNVLERQLNDALEDAGMADEDYSTSDEDDFNSDDDDNNKDDSGIAEQNNDKANKTSKNKKSSSKKTKKAKTSRSSKDPIYGEVSTTETDSEEEAERLISGSNKEPSSSPTQKETTTAAAQEERNKQIQDQHQKEKQEQQQEKINQQEKFAQAATKQFLEMNKRLPVGQRRSMTDRNVLILVIIVGTLCGLIGGLLSGTVVYWNLSSAAVSPEILQQFAAKNLKSTKQDL